MKNKILIVAGGTGGHIIPAISIGKWINDNHPECSLIYVCGERPIEDEIYSRYGIDPVVLPIEGSPMGTCNPLTSYQRSISIFRSFFKTWRVLRKEKPSVCILFGGYISFPVLIISTLMGISSVIHEQNARAGKITRIASRLRKKVLSGWDVCEPLPFNRFKTVGIPVRKFNRLQDLEAWNILHVGSKLPEGPIIVVMGGSLGSKSVFDHICTIASRDEMNMITFLLLGGTGVCSGDIPGNVVLVPRTWDLTAPFSLADAAVVRAGASTLYEMALYGIPCVVIPWESASEDHQAMNAEIFVKQYGGLIWDENDSILSLITKIRDVIDIKKPFSDAQIEAGRVRVTEKIWEETFLTTGREIL